MRRALICLFFDVLLWSRINSLSLRLQCPIVIYASERQDNVQRFFFTIFTIGIAPMAIRFNGRTQTTATCPPSGSPLAQAEHLQRACRSMVKPYLSEMPFSQLSEGDSISTVLPHRLHRRGGGDARRRRIGGTAAGRPGGPCRRRPASAKALSWRYTVASPICSSLVLQLAVQVLSGDELLAVGQGGANRVLLLGLAFDMFNHYGRGHAFFFRSSQQPVASRSATVLAGSSVSTVMWPILRSWRTSALP